jgi:hypothetical protein
VATAPRDAIIESETHGGLEGIHDMSSLTGRFPRRSFVATSVVISIGTTHAANASARFSAKSDRWMVVADDDQDGLWLTATPDPTDKIIAEFDSQHDAERFLAQYIDDS